MNSFRVLVVESTNSSLCAAVAGILQDAAVVCARSFGEAVSVLRGRDGRPDMLILDMDAPCGDAPSGLAVLREMGRGGPVRPTVALAEDPRDLNGLPDWVVVLPKAGAEVKAIALAVGACAEPSTSWARRAAEHVAEIAASVDRAATRRSSGSRG